MKVLKATQAQYKALEGYRNGSRVLRFATDANGNYIIGKGVLTHPAYEAKYSELEELEEIDYAAPPVEEE